MTKKVQIVFFHGSIKYPKSQICLSNVVCFYILSSYTREYVLFYDSIDIIWNSVVQILLFVTKIGLHISLRKDFWSGLSVYILSFHFSPSVVTSNAQKTQSLGCCQLSYNQTLWGKPDHRFQQWDRDRGPSFINWMWSFKSDANQLRAEQHTTRPLPKSIVSRRLKLKYTIYLN